MSKLILYTQFNNAQPKSAHLTPLVLIDQLLLGKAHM